MSFFGEVDNSVGYAVELWIFKPQESGQQVSCGFFALFNHNFDKFGMVNLKIGDTFLEEEKNIFTNILEMKQTILPFEWHSFCICIDPLNKTLKVYHNNLIQAEQDFTMIHGDKKGIAQLMTTGHLGGPKFVGFLTDFQMFGSALKEKNLLGWTVCNRQVMNRKTFIKMKRNI